METLSWWGVMQLTKTHPHLSKSVFKFDKKIRNSAGYFLSGNKANVFMYDAHLGWFNKKSWKSEDAKEQTNSVGMRDHREYSEFPPDGTLRILSIGDSFTYGSQSANNKTWQHYLRTNQPNWEVLNFGVPGYGLDQSYLLYEQEKQKWHPDVVIIGFFTGDILRQTNVFRPFLEHTAGAITKPRFVLQDKQLVHIRNPFTSITDYEQIITPQRNDRKIIEELGKNDAYFQRYYRTGVEVKFWTKEFLRISSHIAKNITNNKAYYSAKFFQKGIDEFDITIAIFDALIASIQEQGAVPIVLILPGRSDWNPAGTESMEVYSNLQKWLKKSGYNVLDGMQTFSTYAEKEPLNDLFRMRKNNIKEFGHYSAKGNELIAEAIQEYVLQRNAQYMFSQ